MNHTKKMNAILLLLGVILSFNVAAKSTDNLHESMPTVLHVRGEAELKVAPNQVTILLGVTTQNKTAKKALSDNSRSMNKIIAALNKSGISEKELNTQRFGVQPIWSSRPRNFSGSEAWKSSITGYRVNNTIKVVTTQLDLVGELINVATVAGANQVQSINFSLSNPRKYREQAIVLAISNAKEDAQFVAKASKLTVSGIKTIHLDNSAASTERVAHKSFARSALSSVAESSAAPPIKSDDIIVRASVSVEYLLSE